MVTPATYPLWRLLELDHNSVHGDGWTEGGGGGLGRQGSNGAKYYLGCTLVVWGTLKPVGVAD